MKKLSCLLLVFLLTFSLFSQNQKKVGISVKLDNIPEAESSWLGSAVSEKLEANITTYTDYQFINTSNLKEILDLQKESSSLYYDEDEAITGGKTSFQDYQLFLTIRKTLSGYSLSASLSDITTGLNLASVFSKIRETSDELYAVEGSAVDEVTVALCESLGCKLTKEEKEKLLKTPPSIVEKENETKTKEGESNKKVSNNTPLKNEDKSLLDMMERAGLVTGLKELPSGTDGSYGGMGTYFLFGNYPQSSKEDNVRIKLSKKYNINGWECYLGSDECFYIKQGDKNYFKMEAIKWRRITKDYQFGSLLVAEDILFPSVFNNTDDERFIDGDKIYPNNYKYSNIRALLNGYDGRSYNCLDYSNKGFIDKAFTNEQLHMILSVNVDNDDETIYDYDGRCEMIEKYISDDTEDKVFLLSLYDLTSPYFGFDRMDRRVKERRRPLTSYARYLGAYEDKNNYKGNGYWWIRSPLEDVDYYESYAACVSSEGLIEGSRRDIETKTCGVIPSIVIIE